MKAKNVVKVLGIWQEVGPHGGPAHSILGPAENQGGLGALATQGQQRTKGSQLQGQGSPGGPA